MQASNWCCDSGRADAQVLYAPRASAAYAASAELAARLPGEAAALPILSLELAGVGRQPQLRFDTNHVLLPAVPLNFESSATFRVVNDGYDNLDLRFRLPSDTENIPLQLHFPEGTLVGIAKASIPVVVTFASSKAASFTADAEFLDQDGAHSQPRLWYKRAWLSTPQAVVPFIGRDNDSSCHASGRPRFGRAQSAR